MVALLLLASSPTLGKAMSNSKYRFLFIALAIVPGVSTAADAISREDALELMQECQKQREEKIAPLREEAIQDCVDQGLGDLNYCETYNRSFGEATARAGGGTIPGLFWDLPVCEQAFAAEQYFLMNPGKKTYDPE